MSKFVDQELFNMCAVTALKFSIASGEPLSKTSQIIANEYGRLYRDANLSSDIASSAEKIARFLSEELPKGSLGSACTQMQYCIKNFKLDGSKKRKKVLGGTWFSGEKHELKDKVNTCTANIATYHMLVIGSTIPIAPKGWSI